MRMVPLIVPMACLSLLASALRAEMTGNTIEITLGKVISRSWDDVKKDDYAYGPRQDYNVGRKLTRIYLPYGKADGVYYELSGVSLKDPSDAGSMGEVVAQEIHRPMTLTYKFHFDKPISEFQFSANWSEWNLGQSVEGGFEYSTDGEKWTALRKADAGTKKIIEPFISPMKEGKVASLNTSVLYIRLYTKVKDGAGQGGDMWVKFWTAGSPKWGDAITTFFGRQWQLAVKTAETEAPAAEKAKE